MSATKVNRQRLSQSQEDYLKALYQLGAAEATVSTSQLAVRLGVSAASATEMLGKLAGLGVVAHDRYRGAVLTESGQLVALEMIRHHRLLEMFLAEKLGYGWDEVHEEAERLEHVISETFEARIAAALGQPVLDPHGDPIPSIDGRISQPDLRRLLDCEAGERVTLHRVSDRDPGLLRELDRLGLRPGVELELVRGSAYESPLLVRIDGRRRQVALGIARAVFVA